MTMLLIYAASFAVATVLVTSVVSAISASALTDMGVALEDWEYDDPLHIPAI